MSTATPTTEPQTQRYVSWLDGVAEKLGDASNPILIKETRQALKSRQFVVTFSVILIASFAWTVAGSLSMMPMIYTTPSAQRMLIGYYLLLALPMLLVVPLAAYRSLEAEIDDGTLELLSITALSPWQIVLGKLASASLQMTLYLVVLFPCVAYAYTLRGVDLPTLGLMMAILITSALALTVVAISFAPLARGRTGRVSTLLVVLMILLLAEYLIGAAVITLILYGNPLSTAWTVYSLITIMAVATSICHLLLTTTAAQLTPESENRSSSIRWSLVMFTTLVFAALAFAVEWSNKDGNAAMGLFVTTMFILGGLWTFAGALMAAESSAMTPRIQRELPGTFLTRLMLLFFTPGPATGLVFACLGTAWVAGSLLFGLERIQAIASPLRPREFNMFRDVILCYSAYLIIYLVVVRGIIAIVRIRNHPRVEVGLAALIVVAVLLSLVPYSIGLHMNDYMSYSYNGWQITNFFWTIGEIVDNRAPYLVQEVLLGMTVVAIIIAIMGVGTRALPMRTETPEAVLAARNSE